MDEVLAVLILLMERRSFLDQNDEFTVNIALVHDGEPVIGVVFAPAKDLCYFAEKGTGAWRRQSENAQAVRIFSQIRLHLDGELVIVESRRHGKSELDDFLKVRNIRVKERISAGSSLKFCLVAEGSADLYPASWSHWRVDVAAGDCIYRIPLPRVFARRLWFGYNKPDLKNRRNLSLDFQGRNMANDGQPFVLWFTGLSGSGEKHVGHKGFIEQLKGSHRKAEYLDGDVIRERFPSTGFSAEERDAHIRRVGYLASILEKNESMSLRL